MKIEIHQLYKSLPAVQFDNVCRHCGITNRILVESELFDQWQNGTYIQDAFPHLNDDERELIKTGIHPECFKEIFNKL